MPELTEKLQRYVIQALRLALISPQGLPLHAPRNQTCLFGNQAATKKAAQWCLEAGLLSSVHVNGSKAKITTASLYCITPRGMAHLLKETSPRQVVEQLLRSIEQRALQLVQLTESVQSCRSSLDALRIVVEHLQKLLPNQIPAQPVPVLSPELPSSVSSQKTWAQSRISAAVWGSLPTESIDSTQVAVVAEPLLQQLEQWQKQNPNADCPLPALFHRLQQSMPFLSIGLFQDQLRQLHQQGAIQLHPWTGPLTEIPDPALAMMAGHALVYYVRTTQETT